MTETKFAVLMISIDVLKEYGSNQIGFYASNAASNEEMATSFAEHCTLESLKRMFADTDKRMADLPMQYTTNPQAEIMLKGSISADYIEEIVFDDVKEVSNYTFKYDCVCRKDGSLFRYRSDFNVWQKQENNMNRDTTVQFTAIEIDELPF